MIIVATFVAFFTAGQTAVKPSSVRTLPRKIAAQLEVQGCLIPQVREPGDESAHTNVVRGSFARKGQVDWAVLCSRGGRSKILVFWGGSTSCPDEIRDPLWERLPPGAGITWSADRYILAVSESDVAGYSDPPPARLMQHQGIEDLMDEKSSTVYYCSGGQWIIAARAGSN